MKFLYVLLFLFSTNGFSDSSAALDDLSAEEISYLITAGHSNELDEYTCRSGIYESHPYDFDNDKYEGKLIRVIEICQGMNMDSYFTYAIKNTNGVLSLIEINNKFEASLEYEKLQNAEWRITDKSIKMNVNAYTKLVNGQPINGTCCPDITISTEYDYIDGQLHAVYQNISKENP